MAEALVAGELQSGLGWTEWVAIGDCAGGLTLDGDRVEVQTSGPPDFVALSGTWRDKDAKEELSPVAQAAAVEGGMPPVGECQRYTDCVCGLSDQWFVTGKSGDNPFFEGCSEAKRLLVQAPDDPATCAMGRTMFAELGAPFGLKHPACGP